MSKRSARGWAPHIEDPDEPNPPMTEEQMKAFAESVERMLKDGDKEMSTEARRVSSPTEGDEEVARLTPVDHDPFAGGTGGQVPNR